MAVVEVNREKLDQMAFAAEAARESCMCPFCGMWWDNAVAERLLLAGDAEGYAAWLEETAALPINEQGPDLGHRG